MLNGCGNIEDLLALRLHGGPLAPAERDAVEKHLAGCPACRRSVEDVEAPHDALLRLPGRRVEPPTGLDRRILARIPVSSPARARWRRASHAAGAMAAGALLTLAVQQTLPGKTTAPAVPAAATAQILIREILSLRKQRNDELRREPA